jgi:uncharacterized protein YgiB involved in biofilm formation
MEHTGRMALVLVAGTLLLAALHSAWTHNTVNAPSQIGTLHGNAEQQGTIYQNLDACLAQAKDMDQVQACRDGYSQATARLADAPRYDAMASCEDVYGPGNCVPRGSVVHDGGGGFIPFMMGFMMGGGFGRSPAYYPVFIDRRGTAFAGGYGGGSVISRPSWSGGTPSAVPHASSSVMRGGFGSTAMASNFGSFGG